MEYFVCHHNIILKLLIPTSFDYLIHYFLQELFLLLIAVGTYLTTELTKVIQIVQI